MPFGTPKFDLIVADLHDIRDGLKSGEIIIEKWQQWNDSSLFGTRHQVKLIDLRPVKSKQVVNWSKTHDFVDGLIVKVCVSLTTGTNTGVHLQDMWKDQTFTPPLDLYNSNIKIGAIPGPTEITIEFICIADLKPTASNTANFARAFTNMPYTGNTNVDIPLPHEKLKDLGTSIEPIVAYRDFYPDYDESGDVILSSRNGVPWKPRKKQRALCYRKASTDPFSAHDAPKVNCTCGIYAFDTPDHQDMKDGAYIWGEVYLWGDVLICESGYRAEFAYPKALFVRTNGTKTIRWLTDELEAVYGVPTFLVAKKDGQTLSSIIDVAIAQLAKGGE